MLLEIARLRAYYGASQALFDVHLSVEEGQVVALMGRNGMGKTTTIRTILGLVSRCEGEIRFVGQDVLGLPTHRVARMGIGLVPEGRRCFPNLTVQENLRAAARPGRWTLSGIHDLFPRLEERENQYASSLSGGEQQMLAIARALMTNPRLLILDEASEGLAPVVRQDIWAVIRRLKQEGLSILVVDKSLGDLVPIADRITILEKGINVWTGGSSELTAQIQDRYLGI